jgi:hypothetical protein
MPDVIIREPEQHHTFSPSSLARIEGCPMAWKMCQNMFRETSPDADHGTLLHKAVWDDETFESLTNDRDKEMISTIREKIEDYKRRGCKIYHEKKVKVYNLNGEMLTEGTLDLLVIFNSLAQIVDFKFGANPVIEPKNNPQLQPYVLGIFQEFSEIDTVIGSIWQPTLPEDFYEDYEYVRNAETISYIINRIETIIKRAINAREDDEKSYGMSVENCRYCNKYVCPKFKAWMMRNLQLVGATEIEIPHDVQEMTLDFADAFKTAWKSISEQAEDVVKLCDKCILAAGESKNYKVCKGRTTKKTDWKGFCFDNKITPEMLEPYESYSTSSPYIAQKVRRPRSKVPELKANTPAQIE